MKTYQLIWLNGTTRTFIMEGTAPLLNHKRTQVKHNYPTGKLIIISMEGLKAKYGYK